AAGATPPCQAKVREGVRDRRGLHPEVLGELVDVVFAVQQVPHDPQPGLVRQQLEGGHRQRHLSPARLIAYLCIHLNTCIVCEGGWQLGVAEDPARRAVRSRGHLAWTGLRWCRRPGRSASTSTLEQTRRP